MAPRMDIASLLAPSLAPVAADPATSLVAVSTVLGEAFSDVFAEAMVEATPFVDPPLANVNVGDLQPVVSVQSLEPGAQEIVLAPDFRAFPEDLERAPSPTPDARPDPPPLAEPFATLPRKEAATEAPNAPAQEPDRPEEPPATLDTARADETAALADELVPSPDIPTLDLIFESISPPVLGAPNEPRRAGSFPATAPPSVEAVPSPSALTDVVPATIAGPASAEAVPQGAPALEAAPDLGIVPKVIAEIAFSPAPPTVVLRQEAGEIQAAPLAKRNVEATAVEAEKPSGSKAETSALVDSKVESLPSSKASAGSDETPPDDEAPKDGTPVPGPVRTQTSALERPDSGVDRPTVDRHLVVRQVADRIESLVAARPRGGVTIHLEPRDLGTVTLIVRGLSSALDVQMFASDERVRESLEASRPDLALALAPRQIEIREIRVSIAPSAPTSGNGGTNPDDRPRHHAPSHGAFSGKAAKTATPRAARRSGRGVDLLV